MAMRTIDLLADGGHYFEGPRWRDGRWWVSDIYAGKVCTYDAAGTRIEVLHVDGNPSGLGWLPDGSLLVVSMHDRQVLRRTEDGAVTVYADLSEVCAHDINDMVVDQDGRAFVGTIGFAIAEGDAPRPGSVYRIDPDGAVSMAVDDLWCPNGMVICTDERTLVVGESFAGRMTAFTLDDDGSLHDRRVFAQIGLAPDPGPTEQMMGALELIPDGCTLDAEDCIWVADAGHQRVVRLSPQGAIVDEIAEPDGSGIYACALGGDDGRTLLLCTVPDFFAAAQGIETDQAALKTVMVDVPHAGRP